MRITANNTNTPQFEARFKYRQKLHQKNPLTGSYQEKNVSLLEFNINHQGDFIALRHAVETWNGQSFLEDILNCANQMVQNPQFRKNNHIYILTTQRHNFNKLQKEKVLGFAQMQTDGKKHGFLNFLQVRPDTTYEHDNRTFKNVGKAMVNSFQKKIETIRTQAMYSAANFYDHLGFELKNSDLLEYEWTKTSRV